MSLHFLKPPIDEITKVPWFPLHCVTNNSNARVILNYSIVGDLDQSPMTMYDLKVLKNFPSQRKYLLSTLGVINPFDFRLITFDLDQGEP